MRDPRGVEFVLKTELELQSGRRSEFVEDDAIVDPLDSCFRFHRDRKITVAPCFSDFRYANRTGRIQAASVDREAIVFLLDLERESAVSFRSAMNVSSGLRNENQKHGRQLFLRSRWNRTRIERIYNRVIFDELERRPDLQLQFSFQDELDVAWIPHPNWYYRISKHSLPFIKTATRHRHFLPTNFRQTKEAGSNVLKPLYSFAGLGVEMEPTREKSRALENPHYWILQKKVEYASFVQHRTVRNQSGAADDVRLVGKGRTGPVIILSG